MANTLQADLLTAQTSGFPTGGYAPAIRCIFTSQDGGTTHDYSFDPTVTTNRMHHVEQRQGINSDSALILLSNHDKSIPADLTGYYVDLGWGHNTASGVRYTESDGAVSPRLWVMQQSDISGGPKSTQPQLYTSFELLGVWDAVLNVQPVLIGVDNVYHQYIDAVTILSALTGLTVYQCIEYLIETSLSAQTGITFTLDALDQDDGFINSVIPFPGSGELLRTVNAEAPSIVQTYGDLIRSLLELTKTTIIPRAGGAFKIIYPQASDTADETYYSSDSSGHPFYEVMNRRLNMSPNYIEIFGGQDEITGLPTVAGYWFDPDHFNVAPTMPSVPSASPTPTVIEAHYTGGFMPVRETRWEIGLNTSGECNNRAEFFGRQLKDQILGTRVIIPMDARNELYDRIELEDQRGH